MSKELQPLPQIDDTLSTDDLPTLPPPPADSLPQESRSDAGPPTAPIPQETITDPGPATEPPGRFFLGLGRLLSGLALGVCGFLLGLYIGRGTAASEDDPSEIDDPDLVPVKTAKVINVNTMLPRQKNLVRYLDQPGTIQAYAQAEIFSKASGYLKRIKRDFQARQAAEVASHVLACATGGPLPAQVQFAVRTHATLDRAPQIDIGSRVKEGDVLIDIDAPELYQDIVQKESLWRQSLAEVKLSRTNIATAEAALKGAKFQVKQVEAEIKKYASEKMLRQQELVRLKGLVADGTVAPAFVEEKINEVNAAEAALEASQAKVQVIQAEVAIFSSKLDTARADLSVKESRVRVAEEEMRRAQILAEDARIRAPFDGIVTARKVDEGDFVQNSSRGQSKLLMTVSAIDKVKIVLQVPEKDSGLIDLGVPATIVVDARSQTAVVGRVARHSHALDPNSRTLQAEIDLENRDLKLRPGNYAQMKLALQKIDNAQALRVSAVHTRKGKSYILLVSKGMVRRQPVRIRYDDGQEMEVVKLIGHREVPLDGTEEVVLQKGDLRDGQRVKCKRLSPL